MDVRAAVAFAPGKPLEVTTVALDGPRAGEVLVEIKATGVCHTDESLFRAPIRRASSRPFSVTKARASSSTLVLVSRR